MEVSPNHKSTFRSMKEYWRASYLRRSRSKPATSMEPGPGKQPRWKQALARDLRQSRPKPATSISAGPSQRPPLEQALSSDLHESRPEPTASIEPGLT